MSDITKNISNIKLNNTIHEFIDKEVQVYLKNLKPSNIKFFSGSKWLVNKHDNFRMSYRLCANISIKYAINRSSIGFPVNYLHHIIYYNQHIFRCRYIYITPSSYINTDNNSNIQNYNKRVFFKNATGEIYQIIFNIDYSSTAIIDTKDIIKEIVSYLSSNNKNNAIGILSPEYVENNFISLINNSTIITYNNIKYIDNNIPLQKLNDIPIGISVYRKNRIYDLPELSYNEMCYMMKSIYAYINIFCYIYIKHKDSCITPREIFNHNFLFNIQKEPLVNNTDCRNIYEILEHNYNISNYQLSNKLIRLIKYIDIKEIKFSSNPIKYNKVKEIYNNIKRYFSYYAELKHFYSPDIDNDESYVFGRVKIYKVMLFLMWFGLNKYFNIQSKKVGYNNDNGLQSNLQYDDIEYALLDIKHRYKTRKSKYTRVSNYYIKVTYDNQKNKFCYQYINKKSSDIFLSNNIHIDNSVNNSDIATPIIYNMLDILWSDGTVTSNIRPTTDNVIPIGLCIIPTNFLGENEKARFMALKYASGSINGKLDGSSAGSVTSTNQYLYWSNANRLVNIPDITNYSKLTSNISSIGYLDDYEGNNTNWSSNDNNRIMIYTENNTWVGLEENNSFTGYAMSDINGKENTDSINNLDSLSSYPVVNSVLYYYTKGTLAGDWYLPALGELVFIAANQSRINTVLTAINTVYPSYCMSSLITNVDYLCSSEYDDTYSFRVSFHGGIISTKNKRSLGCAIPMIQK